MKNIVLILIVLLVIGLSAFYYGKSKAEHSVEYKEIKYTQKQIDSIKATVKPIEKEVVKWLEKREELKEKEKEIVYPEEDCKEIVDNLKEQLENCDTVVQLKDTIIYKERLVIEYKDKIIKKMVLPKQKPFGIGVNAGYGINGKPYVGVGVSYNILRF